MVGRSNVGKSTLINAVLKRRNLARTSQTPGKTRAIQLYLVNDRFYLADLPGYGFAKVSKGEREEWRQLILGYLDSDSPIELFFLLLDIRREPSDHDLMMRDWLVESNVAWRAVLTKIDKLSKNGVNKQRSIIARQLGCDANDLILFSGVNKTGADELRSQIGKVLKGVH